MRILMVTASLARGGAERVLCDLARAWSDRGAEVAVALLDGSCLRPVYTLPPSISLFPCRGDGGGPAGACLGLRRTAARFRPDMLVSFTYKPNVIASVCCAGLPVRLVLTEHNDPAAAPVPALWRLMRRMAYRRADRIVMLTRRSLDALPPGLASNAVVIPNPVSPDILKACSGTAERTRIGESFTVAAMGKLSRQKGFDLLVRAFAASGLPPQWRLKIWGDGPLRESLASLFRSLCPDGRGGLAGETADPAAALSGAAIFVLSSRWEGFPCVLLEAMACALPVIAFDCRTGPREIVDDGVTGILVPPGDIDALAAAMRRLGERPDEREALGMAASAAVRERFGISQILGLWDRLVFEPLALSERWNGRR